MNAKKHNPHGRQHERREPAPAADINVHNTFAENPLSKMEKVAAGEPVAVVGTEVEGTAASPGTAVEQQGAAGEAQQLPQTTVTAAEDIATELHVDDVERQKAEAEPRTDHLDGRGNPVYRNEFGACLFLALGGKDFPGEPEHFELIPFELAMFFRGEPDAPDAAGLSHLSLKLKTVLLPDEDPRRVELVVKLFRTVINGLDAIEKADGEKERLAQDAANFRPAHDRLEGDGPFDKVKGREEKSDLGEALDRQHA